MTVNPQGIKVRVIGLGLIACLGALMLRQFVALPQFEARLLDLASTQQLSIARYMARDIDKELRARKRLAETLAAQAPVGQPNQLQDWTRDRQRTLPAFGDGLLIVRPDGAGLLAEYPVLPGRAQRDFTKFSWFQKAIRAAGGSISQAAPVPHGAEPGIVFTAPLRDSAGNTVALLAGVSRLAQPGFLDGLRATQLDDQGELLLVSITDNLVIAASHASEVMKPASSAEAARWQAMSASEKSQGTIAPNGDGENELSVIAAVPSTGWLVVARMRTSEALGPVSGLQRFLWGVTAAVFCMMLVILTVGLGRILKPLVDAANALRDMADGKRQLASLPVVRGDEVGQLVSGFNVLVARLKNEEAARKASEERLQFMAHHDSLTGLYNRAMLEDRLGLELARAERFNSRTSLLFCDLDGFKEINDLYGHHAGDDVLREVARRLSTLRRRADTVARLGGDEFVILLTDVKDVRNSSAKVAQQCLHAMREPFQVNDRQCPLGMSIGIAYHDGAPVTPSSLLDLADLAMYQAKRRGKGRYFFIEDLEPAEAPALLTGAGA
ncbi:MAG: GGDEF domain-containing protein [Pseudomonadota bacterium]